MNENQLDKEQKKRDNTQNAIAGLAAYSAIKTKEMASSMQELATGQKELINSSQRQEINQNEMISALHHIEGLERANLQNTQEMKKIIASNLAETKKNTKVNAMQLAQQQFDSEYNIARDKRKDLEEAIQKEEEERIQTFKNITHQLYRQQQIIEKSPMTNLEKFFTLRKAHDVVKAIPAETFPDTSDKSYRDNTEDEIEKKIKLLQENQSDADKKDLKTIEEIEKKTRI
jgi:FMN-dependent NADH-azoreductase